MARYERLAWDSEFFGFRIGRVDAGSRPDELSDVVAAADGDGIRCLYLLCPADDDALLAVAIDQGFRLYDVRMEFGRELAVGTNGAADARVRPASASEAGDLEHMARERMVGTRFWNDPHFPRDRVADLYAAWVHRGMTGADDHLTLVAGETDGFIVCGFDHQAGVGSIELIAAAAGAAGRGLGDALVAAADRAFVEAGMTSATVVTQARNIAAQRLYQRRGYRTARAAFWLHRWAD